MDSINQSILGLGAEAFAKAVSSPGVISARASQASLNQPAPAMPAIVDLVDAAGSALKRLHGLAESVESLGDKLVGSPEPRTGEGSASGPGPGSLGQIAGYLSMIHATISRIESSTSRLHNIHG